MSDEYIKMCDAIAMCENSKTLCHAIHKIMCMPSADFAQVRHGRWEEIDDLDFDTLYRCSVCGEEFYLIDGTPRENQYYYCPCCGSKMDGGDEDE